MLITREFKFDAAHHLTAYHGKCENVHGHTYKLAVTLEGKVQKNGLVVDFTILKKIVKKHVLDELDHKDLNTVIKNPSAENVAVWIWERLENINELLKEESENANFEQDSSLKLHEIILWESENNYVTFNGDKY
jgi:6-pyruvoyltetrahydropterin/6-carboxytetrahydropterin synthase